MSRQESYRGFPYTVPVVSDVPSLTPQQAAQYSRWENLPRRRITGQSQPSKSSDRCQPLRPAPKTTEPEEVANISHEDDDEREAPQSPSPRPRRPSHLDLPSDTDDDLPPVLYIDIPDSASSNVSQRIAETPQEAQFVEETIFYDPFKDTMVSHNGETDNEQSRGPSSPEDGPSSGPGGSGFSSAAGGSRPYIRPMPPEHLYLPGASESDIPLNVLPYLSKESQLYGGGQTPQHSMTPPCLPPSYEEIQSSDAARNDPGYISNTIYPVESVVINQPNAQVRPDGSHRVEVIAPGKRKILFCKHCMLTVRAVVTKDVGPITHAIACVCPLAILTYWCNLFKYTNHYCPNCNQIIAYEKPCCCGCGGINYTE